MAYQRKSVRLFALLALLLVSAPLYAQTTICQGCCCMGLAPDGSSWGMYKNVGGKAGCYQGQVWPVKGATSTATKTSTPSPKATPTATRTP
jgi:hypothetical protein